MAINVMYSITNGRLLLDIMYGHTYIARVWINHVRLPILHVVS